MDRKARYYVLFGPSITPVLRLARCSCDQRAAMEARCLRDPGRQDRAVIKSTCYWSAGTKLELIMEFSRSPDIGEVAEVQAAAATAPQGRTLRMPLSSLPTGRPAY